MFKVTNNEVKLHDIGISGTPFLAENYEKDVVESFEFIAKDLVAERPNGRIMVLNGNPGSGKCLGRDTPVLMFDGSIVPVQDIKIGDLLMGPDSKPRTVLAVNSDTGPLFKINPIKGTPWVCNDAHILTLVRPGTDEVVDLTMAQLKLMPNKERYKLFRVGVDFPKQKELPLDPYFIGIWFGGGTKYEHSKLGVVAITKPDPEIEAACEDMAKKFGLKVSKRLYENDTCPTWAITGNIGQKNSLKDLLEKVVGQKRNIPKEYLTSSRAERLEFLAGLLDTDGYLHNGGFEIVQKRKDYADAISFVARSLGLMVTSSIKIVNNEEYVRMSIFGDLSVIPNRIPRKKADPRQQIKNALRTGFEAEPIGTGQYFGFTLDSDGRFLLGDFTVTHNSFFIRGLINRCEKSVFVWLWPDQIDLLVNPSCLEPLLRFRNQFRDRPIVFLMEDADALLVKRNSDNMSRFSSFLNLSDGIVGSQLDYRFLLTTNAKLQAIDTALTRPGRLSRMVNCDDLSPGKAEEVYYRLTGKTREFTKPTSLAEVYSLSNNAPTAFVDRTPKKMGFGR